MTRNDKMKHLTTIHISCSTGISGMFRIYFHSVCLGFVRRSARDTLLPSVPAEVCSDSEWRQINMFVFIWNICTGENSFQFITAGWWMLTPALPAQRDRVKQERTVIWTSLLRFCFFPPRVFSHLVKKKTPNTLFNSLTWQDDRPCVGVRSQAKSNVYSQQTDGDFPHDNVCPRDQQTCSTAFWLLW